MPKPVAVLGWAIERFQSRSGRWTSWPGGVAERVRRRQFVIKSQVQGHGHKLIYIYTNICMVKYPVSVCYALAVQWQSKRKVCRRSRVRILFATFLNPGIAGIY